MDQQESGSIYPKSIMNLGKGKSIDFLNEAEELARNRFYWEAIKLYESILTQYPKDLRVLYGLGACLFRTNNLIQAERYVSLVLKKDPHHAKAKQVLKLIQEKKFKSAETLLDGCADEYVDDDLAADPANLIQDE